MNENKIEETIFKHALLNAIKHNGKANSNAILGKILAEAPELKNKIKEIIPKIEEIVKEINSLSIEEQKNKLNELGLIIEKKKIEKIELPELPYAIKGKVVTAFPPEPSKYPHIGHAKSALINFLYAKKYDGKFILRFEDTNPRMVKKEYYDAFIEGLKWLEIDWDQIDYVSDYIEKFYEASEFLIKKGYAYVCTCKQEDIRKNRKLMKECDCRKNEIEKNLSLFDEMLNGNFNEGEATLRMKISMSHKNAAMRDPSIMRIIDYSHPRVGNKHKVWPMYDFGTALMDGWEGITHRIRSKEFEIRTELQQYIQKIFNFKIPYIMEIARFNLEGAPSSGRKIREMIKSGELHGWDDPRLTTLLALRRRGFLPEAIKEFLIITGISKSEAIIAWSNFESINRSILDKIANRFFCVINPIKINILNAPKIDFTFAPYHPEFPERGKRKIPVKMDEIYISKDDFEKYLGKKIRLMNLFNIKLEENAIYIGEKIIQEFPKIQWVSYPNIKIKILMPDGSLIEGLAEPELAKQKIDEKIQLVRIGFARIDSLEPFILYFTHK
ncbi:MAG: glutamate--tRNA ligase [Nitrososphaerota archaeon]